MLARIKSLFSSGIGLFRGRGLIIGGLAVAALIGGQFLTIHIQGLKIEALRADAKAAAHSCNERVMASIVEAQKLAIEQQAAAVLRERKDWTLRLTASQNAAKAATDSREAEKAQKQALQVKLNELYQTSESAAAWAGSPIPDSVLDSLRQP